MLFRNDNAFLKFHKESLRGKTQDYIIHFHKEQMDLQHVLLLTSDLFKQLIESFGNKNLVARLVAKVRFIHVNNMTDEMEERFYHFSSYGNEPVIDADDFFQRHMAKIASRLDSFNVNGSNLMIKNIAYLHIILTLR